MDGIGAAAGVERIIVQRDVGRAMLGCVKAFITVAKNVADILRCRRKGHRRLVHVISEESQPLHAFERHDVGQIIHVSAFEGEANGYRGPEEAIHLRNLGVGVEIDVGELHSLREFVHQFPYGKPQLHRGLERPFHHEHVGQGRDPVRDDRYVFLRGQLEDLLQFRQRPDGDRRLVLRGGNGQALKVRVRVGDFQHVPVRFRPGEGTPDALRIHHRDFECSLFKQRPIGHRDRYIKGPTFIVLLRHPRDDTGVGVNDHSFRPLG